MRRTVGDKLWESIKPSGFASERFKLHLSPTLAIDLRSPEDNNGLEPSLLIYQSELCSAMLNHLESNFQSRMRISFQTRLTLLDALNGVATLQKGEEEEEFTADLVAGCDGVNSAAGRHRFEMLRASEAVRSSIAAACPGFQVTETKIPGSFKVLRFPKPLVFIIFFIMFCPALHGRMPAKLDPTAVHAIPGKGGSSAFVEPTAG